MTDSFVVLLNGPTYLITYAATITVLKNIHDIMLPFLLIQEFLVGMIANLGFLELLLWPFNLS